MADTPYDLQSYYYSPQTKQLENLVTAQKIEQAPLLMDKTRAETEKIKAESAESGAKLSKMLTDAEAEKAYTDSAKELLQNDPTIKDLPLDELADRIAKYALTKSPQHAISMMGIASKLKTERGTQEKNQREAKVFQNEVLEGAFNSLRSDQNDIAPETLMSMAVNGKMSKEHITALRNKWQQLSDDINGPANKEKLKQQLIDEVQTSKDRVAKQTAKRDEMANQVALAKLAEVREGHRVDALRLEARISAGDRAESARDKKATNESDARVTRALGATMDEINDVQRDMTSAKNNAERVELIKKVGDAKQAIRDNPIFTSQNTLTKNLEDAQTALEENEAPYRNRIKKLTKERESLKRQYSDNFLKRTGQAEATPETAPEAKPTQAPSRESAGKITTGESLKKAVEGSGNKYEPDKFEYKQLPDGSIVKRKK